MKKVAKNSEKGKSVKTKIAKLTNAPFCRKQTQLFAGERSWKYCQLMRILLDIMLTWFLVSDGSLLLDAGDFLGWLSYLESEELMLTLILKEPILFLKSEEIKCMIFNSRSAHRGPHKLPISYADFFKFLDWDKNCTIYVFMGLRSTGK